MPILATLLLWFVAAGVLSLLCGGAAVYAVVENVRPEVERAKRRRAEKATERDRRDDVKALLDVLADRLVVAGRSRGELPATLDEAPPRDPWGNPIRYDRRTEDRAELRSSGPDGKFDTRDDVRREVGR